MHFPMQLAFPVFALKAGVSIPVGEAWFLGAYLVVTPMAGRFVFLRFEAPLQDLIRAATLAPSGARAAA